MDNSIRHHGVKGQKWGVRRQKYSIIKKGTELTRVSLNPYEPIDNNRKYVSDNKEDQQLWENKLVRPYKNMGYDVYKYKYMTIKDIKMSSSYETGKQFTDKIMSNPNFKSLVIQGNEEYRKRSGMKETDLTTDFFRSLGWNTTASKEYMNDMRNKGYDAISDLYGQSSGAKNPIILLKPNEAIKLKSISDL